MTGEVLYDMNFNIYKNEVSTEGEALLQKNFFPDFMTKNSAFFHVKFCILTYLTLTTDLEMTLKYILPYSPMYTFRV